MVHAEDSMESGFIMRCPVKALWFPVFPVFQLCP